MKTKLLSKFAVLFFLIATLAYAQGYLAVAEKMPVMKGGMKALYSEIKYPRMAKDAGVQGKVYLLMYINESGKVDKVECVKGIGAGCDEAAKDAALKLKFSPAEHKGAKVKVKMAIAVKFKLEK